MDDHPSPEAATGGDEGPPDAGAAFKRDGRARAAELADMEPAALARAVEAALCDQVFALPQSNDEAAREKARTELFKLSKLLLENRKVAVMEERAQTEKRRVALLESRNELLRQKMEGEIRAAQEKAQGRNAAPPAPEAPKTKAAKRNKRPASTPDDMVLNDRVPDDIALNDGVSGEAPGVPPDPTAAAGSHQEWQEDLGDPAASSPEGDEAVAVDASSDSASCDCASCNPASCDPASSGPDSYYPDSGYPEDAAQPEAP